MGLIVRKMSEKRRFFQERTLTDQDFLTPNEFNRLMMVVHKPYHKAAFVLAFTCGLRISEVTNLKQENIDRQTNQLRIKESKGGKSRNIPYNKKVSRYLKHIPMKIGIRTLQASLKRAMLRAGIKKDIHFHSLRHSFASNMLRGGASLKVVQQLMGHSNISTTNIYLHTTKEDIRNAVDEVQSNW